MPTVVPSPPKDAGCPHSCVPATLPVPLLHGSAQPLLACIAWHPLPYPGSFTSGQKKYTNGIKKELLF
jgi:hypothetical protein